MQLHVYFMGKMGEIGINIAKVEINFAFTTLAYAARFHQNIPGGAGDFHRIVSFGNNRLKMRPAFAVIGKPFMRLIV